ncbi:hypothetical protein [Urbifossiella limnaea]|uniref:Protein BatD n=1 Tax=Urbifossiella limnaea TaxID=2528023 RepID=A0A517XMP5_9BACT|nr:hypothetical protein [Urbifossiella limnaea]QDU18774.1 hypothetical protein ETAA1_06700 [Urbifossiella limnaea]
MPRPAGLPLLLLPLLLAAQPAGVVPQAAVAPDALWLADTARLTVTVEGPAPLRVELPEKADELLDDASRRVWKIDQPGPPAVTPLDGGRERWSRTYRLSPFVPGDSVPVGFDPVKVRAGGAAFDTTFPTVAVVVKASGTPPTLEGVEVRGIEDLPPVTPPPPGPVGWVLAGVLGAVFAAGIVAGLVRKWRAKPPAPPPVVRAWAELDRAAAAPPGPAAERVAAALREYAARRFGVPALHLTTAELAAAPWPEHFPADVVAALADILAACDRAKFAAEAPAADLIGPARSWVTAAEAQVRP